ncbi:hypothetical protein [Nitrosomonas marina]|uniref:hypothetical protein n=1 Tax=Nitrosomonas marina TaxID=917 RepID=UPI00115FE63F|nr:hypothetical protein [Nitrosomonas marina]
MPLVVLTPSTSQMLVSAQIYATVPAAIPRGVNFLANDASAPPTFSRSTNESSETVFATYFQGPDIARQFFTNISANVSIEGGSISAGGAPLLGGSAGGSWIRLVATNNAGSILCEDEVEIQRFSSPGVYSSASISPRTENLNCTARNPDGGTVEAKVILRAWADAGGFAGANSQTRIDVNTISTQHCNMLGSEPGNCRLASLRSFHNRFLVAEQDGNANANRENNRTWGKMVLM